MKINKQHILLTLLGIIIFVGAVLQVKFILIPLLGYTTWRTISGLLEKEYERAIVSAASTILIYMYIFSSPLGNL